MVPHRHGTRARGDEDSLSLTQHGLNTPSLTQPTPNTGWYSFQARVTPTGVGIRQETVFDLVNNLTPVTWPDDGLVT